MKQRRAILPDGRELVFPGDATDEEIALAVNSMSKGSPQQPEYNPAEGMSFMEAAQTGGGKFFENTGRGAMQLGAEALALPPGDPLNMRPVAQQYRSEEEESRALDQPLMDTAGGKTGYLGAAILSNLLPGTLGGAAQVIGAPRTFGQAALSGATQGMVMPATSPSDRLRNTVLSTAGSVAGQIPGYAFQHAARPMQMSPEAEYLLKQGVVPTPGQAARPGTFSGRTVRNLEERISSAPLVGEPIHRARERAVNELNAAALRRAGGKGFGQEAIAERGRELGMQMDDLASRVGYVQGIGTRKFNKALNNITSALDGVVIEDNHKEMYLKQARRFLDILDANGGTTGEQLAALRSQWAGYARDYGASSDASQRALGKALRKAADELDDFTFANTTRDIAAEYKKVRDNYRHLVIMETAAAKAANRPNQPGVATPDQYMQSVKENAQGMKRRTVSQGKATDQDLATAGMILKNTRPDSGTTERYLTTGLVLGGLGGSGMINPAIPIAATGGTLLGYGVRPVTKYLIGGGKLQGAIADTLRGALSPPGSLLGAYTLPETR